MVPGCPCCVKAVLGSTASNGKLRDIIRLEILRHPGF